MIGIDWVLSFDGRFYSTAFAAALTTTQILAALSWVAAAGIAPTGGAGKAGDVAGLMIAAALGSLYLGFSQYLVIWYGNIPERITWYLDRQHGPWPWIDLLAIVLSGLLPVFALMRQRWRNDPRISALIGYCVLVGLFAHLVWLVAPRFGTMAILSAILAVVAIGGPWLALAYAFAAPRLGAPCRLRATLPWRSSVSGRTWRPVGSRQLPPATAVALAACMAGLWLFYSAREGRLRDNRNRLPWASVAERPRR